VLVLINPVTRLSTGTANLPSYLDTCTGRFQNESTTRLDNASLLSTDVIIVSARTISTPPSIPISMSSLSIIKTSGRPPRRSR